jgi:hypothetical protein
MLSHSVESSRAVPTEKLIERVETQPFIPETLNKRVKGMGVGDALTDQDLYEAKGAWREACDASVASAYDLLELNVDKSRANRLLEPFMFVTDLVTGTDWDNFFALRDHPDAQPEFQIIASMLREAMEYHEPIELYDDEWHLPLVRYEDEFIEAQETKHWKDFAMISAGRCCRWSYGVNIKTAMAEDKNTSYNRANRLLQSFHMSPMEHQAKPYTSDDIYAINKYENMIAADQKVGDDVAKAMMNGLEYSGNLKLWHQFRKSIANEDNFSKANV